MHLLSSRKKTNFCHLSPNGLYSCATHLQHLDTYNALVISLSKYSPIVTETGAARNCSARHLFGDDVHPVLRCRGVLEKVNQKMIVL